MTEGLTLLARNYGPARTTERGVDLTPSAEVREEALCKLPITALRCMAHTAQPPLTPSVRDCGSPPALSNGQLSYTTTTYLSTANYSCDIGYNLRGPSELTCQASLQWRYGDSHYGFYHQHPPQSCQSKSFCSQSLSSDTPFIFSSLSVQLLTVALRVM